MKYSALPTNMQFVECGVKESGYITLGQRNKTNCSIMAVMHDEAMMDALRQGREEINKTSKERENRAQLQSKKQSLALLRGIIKHNNDVAKLQKEDKANFDKKITNETKAGATIKTVFQYKNSSKS
eukprot:12643229-Ditylum_brightwellii.AAC.1